MVPRPKKQDEASEDSSSPLLDNMSSNKRRIKATPNRWGATDKDHFKQTDPIDAPLVTPSTSASARRDNDTIETPTDARRILFSSVTSAIPSASSSLITPQSSAKRKQPDSAEKLVVETPTAKRRLIFGKYVDLIIYQPNVEHVYKIVRKLTGSIGGNGYVGPIYGELTMGSMQKMVNLMMEHCDFNANSRFIDVGSGIGKPNLHVAQYPGVAFSCGVEVEQTRWALGMTCLNAVLGVAKQQHQHHHQQQPPSLHPSAQIQGNTVFLHKDIMEAATFDPFTHVYMFSIGFPPPLWLHLSEMWNDSQSEYLICYHGPKTIIHSYEFNVELLVQTSTSMHGSKEVHMGYLYKRKTPSRKVKRSACDKLFQQSWDLVKTGLLPLEEDVAKQVEDMMGSGRKTRSRTRNQ